jgi:hypothetical protein
VKKPARLRPPAKLPESIQFQLNRYALAVSAAGACLLSVPAAQAEIVYTPAHVKMDKVNGFYPIDFDNNGVVDVGIWMPSSCTSSLCAFTMFAYPNSQLGDAVEVNAKGATKALHFGASIGSADRFVAADRIMGGWEAVRHGSNTWVSAWVGPWANAGNGVKHRYVGVKFLINNEFHYGWARINFVVSGKSTFYGVLTGYAYETIPNQGLKAGQTVGTSEATRIEAPAVIRPTIKRPTLGQLAAGALAISEWRAKQATTTSH